MITPALNVQKEALVKWGKELNLFPKKQQKTKESTQGLADAKVKKENKSVQNIRTYQTQLKDPVKQQAREQKAKDVGLKGHGSSNSNSGQNNATKGGLAKINRG